jgi:hypothetical protein
MFATATGEHLEAAIFAKCGQDHRKPAFVAALRAGPAIFVGAAL